LAKEAGVSPTTVSAIETGKIGRPHFGTLGKLALALGVAPEELLDSRKPAEQQGPAPLSLGWARDTGEGEFESGLENAFLESLDSLSLGLDVEQERLQRLYGEFPEGSEQGRFIKRQIREVAPTCIPAALAASQVRLIRARTAGWSALWSRRSRSLPLSAARVYWTRSFVPIEKKADCSASSPAQSAAAGVSIITPVSTSPTSIASDSSFLRHSCRTSEPQQVF
jgi:transcriptional regulator with XRE-family HTH domain